MKERIEKLKDLEKQEAEGTFNLLTKKEAALRRKELEKLLGDDEDEDEWEEIDLDAETDWNKLEEEIEEELHGKQRKLDKNKNGRLDKEDFKMLRKKHMEENDEDTEPLYEVEFELDLNEYSMGDDDLEDVKPYGDYAGDPNFIASYNAARFNWLNKQPSERTVLQNKDKKYTFLQDYYLDLPL
jgi:hypothetical protein